MDRSTSRIHFSLLREKRGSHSRIQGVCVIRRSNGGRVVEVGMETVSPGRTVDGRVLAGDLDQAVGLTTCERGLFSHSAKPATAAGINARDTRFRLQSVRKSRTTLRRAFQVATRHEMEE